MDELNPTVREQEIYEEMELTPEMIKSIRTLWCCHSPLPSLLLLISHGFTGTLTSTSVSL